MENINIDKKEKYKCIFKSQNLKKNIEYIQSSKFISKDSFIIFNNKKIIKYNYNYNQYLQTLDSIEEAKTFIENDYIYDYDIISNLYESTINICICSKSNPIRILTDNLSLIKSFSLENKQKECYLSSTFIKYEPYGLNIFTGRNFLSKIDIIKQKEINTIYNKNYNYLSCFDFDIKYSCYFLGSYSYNLLLCDYKTDKIIHNYKQENPVNQIKIIKSKEYKILVGYRNSEYIHLFDIRKMDKYINKIERRSLTTKKINFILDDKEKNLYSGTDNGKLIRFFDFEKIENKEINNENNIKYEYDDIKKEEIDIGLNKCISSIDLNNDFNLMIVTSGEYNYDEIFNSLINSNDSDNESENKIDYKDIQFNIYKL